MVSCSLQSLFCSYWTTKTMGRWKIGHDDKRIADYSRWHYPISVGATLDEEFESLALVPQTEFGRTPAPPHTVTEFEKSVFATPRPIARPNALDLGMIKGRKRFIRWRTGFPAWAESRSLRTSPATGV